MCGYTSHQDGRLIPPNEREREPEYTCDYSNCEHGEACRALYERLRGHRVNERRVGWEEHLVEALGCDQCKEWKEWVE